MASSASPGPGALAAPARLSLPVAWLLRAGWLLLQVGALALAVAATPALHAHYQAVCGEPLCETLARPNAESVRLLARLGIPLDAYAAALVAVAWLVALVWAALGAVIAWKRPRDPVGLLVACGGTVIGGGEFLDALAQAHPRLAVPAQLGTLVATAAGALFVALFPDGRWVPRWSRWVGLAAIGYGAVYAFAARPLAGPLAAAEVPLGLALWGVLLGTQVYRYRRVSGAIQRQQAKWLLAAVGLFVANVGFVVGALALGLLARYQFAVLAAGTAAIAAMPLAVGFAILRHRLFDIDLILNRALLYGGLTVGVVGLYALIVAGLGAVLRVRGGFVPSALATGVVALLFHPFRERLQRGVNRLLYGERDEPYAVVSRLGRRLEASLAPEAVLPTIVETVAAALKLPYAAIALRDEGGMVVAAEHGTAPPGVPVAVPLVYRGEALGELRLAPRPGERAFSPGDRRLVDDLARQAGIAVRATQPTRDLQRARGRLVAAREEERRRLRRDLHDGLGPALASHALTVDTAQLLLERDPQGAAALLRTVKAQSQAAVAEIRRVVYGLRPPALDDLGLAGALREAASRYAGTGLDVTLEAPEPLPPLPAAVEVAAYHIAQEALTNAARHARARRCAIALAVGPTLEVSVADDGAGIPADRRAGVGLSSMRERAEELGGTCSVEPGPGGGTRVTASLPL